MIILDKNTTFLKQYYCDRDLKTLIPYCCKVLSSVHTRKGSIYNNKPPYSELKKEDNFLLWAEETLSNYVWTSIFMYSLCLEYEYRFNRKHPIHDISVWYDKNLPIIKKVGLTEFPITVPQKYIVGDPISSFREYYFYKRKKDEWTNRTYPAWLKKLKDKKREEERQKMKSKKFKHSEEELNSINPSITAISRSGSRSAAYKTALSLWKDLDCKNVLDYGCGFGEEADENSFYKMDKYMYADNKIRLRNLVLKTKRRREMFDHVICSCVLNTIPTKEERFFVIDKILHFMRQEGTAIFTYYKDAVASEKEGWKKYSDGFIYNSKRGTHFQKRYTDQKFYDLFLEFRNSEKFDKMFDIERIKSGIFLIRKKRVNWYPTDKF